MNDLLPLLFAAFVLGLSVVAGCAEAYRLIKQPKRRRAALDVDLVDDAVDAIGASGIDVGSSEGTDFRATDANGDGGGGDGGSGD